MTDEGPRFTLPTHFPPHRGETGADGRRVHRGETFALVQGYRNLLLDVVVPPRPDDDPVPCVVWIHGGAFLMGATDEIWSPWFATMRERVLAAGFAFASVSYRFSSEATFPAQVHDVRAGIRWLRHYSGELGIDPDGFALWGGSAGAQLALLVGFTAGTGELEGQVGVEGEDRPFAAIVDFFGPAEVLTVQADKTDGDRNDHDAPDSPFSRLIGAPITESVELARRASPISYVRPDIPPVLIYHGTDDTAIGPNQSRRLAAALADAGAPVELVEIEGADHGFIGVDMDPVLDHCIEFLAGQLAERSGAAGVR